MSFPRWFDKLTMLRTMLSEVEAKRESKNMLKTPRKPLKYCALCGDKPVFSMKSSYCRPCSNFMHRMTNEKFSPETIKAIVEHIHKNGFRCEYTWMALDLDDDTSPWYCSFDHYIPRDGQGAKVVLTSAWLNAMKTDLTIKEFWYYVLALFDHRMRHIKVKKRKPIYWWRIVPYHRHKYCPICGKPKRVGHEYCPRCAAFGHRMKAKFPKKTLKAIWAYVRKYGFVCYYTGMRLNMTNPHSAFYLVFDHCTPGDGRKVVITSFLVNDMKSDMTEGEFWYMISQLAAFYRKGTPVRRIKLKCWSRPYGR